MIRHLALCAFLAATAAAPASALNPQPEPPGRSIPMADGSIVKLAPGGKVVKLVNGRAIPLAPGSYKLKNGKILTIEATGTVSAASRVELNPQPLPP